ncbi:MAG: helix-turn-helix domain-containing protein [Oscillospiraceae bacterium]
MRRLRKERNWSVTKMAMVIGISESYLAHLLSMKDNRYPSLPLLEQICNKTNVDIAYFF